MKSLEQQVLALEIKLELMERLWADFMRAAEEFEKRLVALESAKVKP
jgi:hypothetical protein